MIVQLLTYGLALIVYWFYQQNQIRVLSFSSTALVLFRIWLDFWSNTVLMLFVELVNYHKSVFGVYLFTQRRQTVINSTYVSFKLG